MPIINCTKCGQEIEVEKVSGDYSTFVCGECQEKINLPAYERELEKYLAKSDRTESEDRRIEFLKAKISSIEE